MNKLDGSIFTENVLDSIKKNSSKTPKAVEDNSTQQFSEAMTDSDIDKYIKRMRGERNDRVQKP